MAADDAAITSLLRSVLSDPGKSAERKRLHTDWCPPDVYEPMPHWQARAVIAALEKHGFAIIPVAELERFQEIAAQHEGRFTAKEVIKPDRDKDFYVGWSHVVEAPVWAGTRAQALADGCPPSRLRRADKTGTSIKDGFGCDWDDSGLIAEQRGYLRRAKIAAYVTAYMEGRMSDAFDQLEPFDGETEVRRD